MNEEEKKKESGEISRREFLKDAGLVVGGAAIGSTVLLAACGEAGETATVTKTATQIETVTTTQQVGTATTTVMDTTTVSVSKFICPIDGMEFDTLAALQAHFEAAHPGEVVPEKLTKLTVNGYTYELIVEPEWSLAFLLRDRLGWTGTKVICDGGECGACTVLVDGKSVLSCIRLALDCDGKDIVTVEGLLGKEGELHPIQEAYWEHGAVQCGMCVPGYIMATKFLLDANPNPSEADVRVGLSGHLCRCGIQPKAIEAVLAVAGK